MLLSVLLFLLVCFIAIEAKLKERKIPVIVPTYQTNSLIKYFDSPSTPDADDPSIYVTGNRSFLFGTAKNAGLGVWDLKGNLLQWISPLHRERTTEKSPPTPAGLNDITLECDGLIEQDIFGRYNGVSYLKNIDNGKGVKIDVAVVTDRGCDRLRMFSINSEKKEILTEISHDDIPRVFPMRINQPSPFQNSDEHPISSNRLVDQNTAYGLETYTDSDGKHFAFVSQLFRSVVAQVQIFVLEEKVTYKVVRHFVFNMVHTLTSSSGVELKWTPCRQDPEDEEPMAEGMAVHKSENILYVGFEEVGLFKVHLSGLHDDDSIVHIGQEYLVSPVQNYGKSYAAIDDGWNIHCKYDANEDILDDEKLSTVYVKGSNEHMGEHIVSDLEGVAIAGENYIVVSSQGDSTFHVFAHSEQNEHVGSFQVEGVKYTDGIDIHVDNPGDEFSDGLVVVQNGRAQITGEYVSTDYEDEIDGATGFVYFKWRDVKQALNL